MYNNPYQPYVYQQYGQPMVPYQQPLQMPQARPALSGRMVGDIGEVTAQEIPMDGSVSFFPTRDYSCVYAKQWNADGTITTLKFVPEVVEQNETEKGDLSAIMEQLTEVKELINKLL